MEYIKYTELTKAICALQDDYTKPTASAKAIGAMKALSQVMQICSDLCENTAHDDDDLIDTLNNNPFNRLMSTADAAAYWNITEDAIRKAIKANRLEPGRDCQKYGKQWIIHADAMTRVFGPQRISIVNGGQLL